MPPSTNKGLDSIKLGDSPLFSSSSTGLKLTSRVIGPRRASSVGSIRKFFPSPLNFLQRAITRLSPTIRLFQLCSSHPINHSSRNSKTSQELMTTIGITLPLATLPDHNPLEQSRSSETLTRKLPSLEILPNLPRGLPNNRDHLYYHSTKGQFNPFLERLRKLSSISILEATKQIN